MEAFKESVQREMFGRNGEVLIVRRSYLEGAREVIYKSPSCVNATVKTISRLG
jgi:hypothetical protein